MKINLVNHEDYLLFYINTVHDKSVFFFFFHLYFLFFILIMDYDYPFGIFKLFLPPLHHRSG